VISGPDSGARSRRGWSASQPPRPATGRRLYKDIVRALFRASNWRHEVVARKDLQRIWEENFIDEFIRNRRAEVEILCGETPHEIGYELTCTAIRIDTKATAAALAFGRAVFPERRQRYRMAYGLSESMGRLTDGGPPPQSLTRWSSLTSVPGVRRR